MLLMHKFRFFPVPKACYRSGQQLINNHSASDALVQTRVVNTRWQKPAAGCFKCNVDASFFTRTNRVNLDMCITDEFGALVLAETESFNPICDVCMLVKRLIFYRLSIGRMN
ncbi:cytochrome p450 [Trifolium pratense]|uniref:Cytochrome p450 n=1 Tax=Trifolium pratense TaxID=57577 RepID=A0A2K3N424_TRIPR|nr:cytochrome p450 [Trifolium pratense]